jgi:HTH-type transcriptional regulator/antitoxin HipB
MSPFGDMALDVGKYMLIRTPQDLGFVIREQRKKLGLDQSELARRAAVSRQWIVEVEKGKPRAEVGLLLRTESPILALIIEKVVSTRDRRW